MPPNPPRLMIRDVAVAPNLVLAPMEGVTDLTFRRLVRAIGGCGLTFTEFVGADALARHVRRAVATVASDADERPFCVQVVGRRPDALAEAARVAEDLGADLVDLNMGCPSRKVCAHSGGAALMRDPAAARGIVRALRAALTVPLTVKMRAGWDHASRNAPDIASMCEDEGVDAVTVHWRTRADRYAGERDLDTVAAVVERVGIPVLANGDIVDAASALDTLRRTGCQGLMIGRGAITNPWVFQEIAAALRGEPIPLVTLDDRQRVLLGYFEEIRARFRDDRGALGRFKKIARYYTGGVEGGDALRAALLHARSADEAVVRIRVHFEGLRETPREASAAQGG